MRPYYEEAGITIYHGDCLAVLNELPSECVDSRIHRSALLQRGTGDNFTRHDQGTVFRYPRTEDDEHPTVKPQLLIERILSCVPLAVVLDPFIGSGSTLVAAKRLGARAIGIELEEKYCEIAATRLQQGVLNLTA